jgi:hypothetical protein
MKHLKFIAKKLISFMAYFSFLLGMGYLVLASSNQYAWMCEQNLSTSCEIEDPSDNGRLFAWILIFLMAALQVPALLQSRSTKTRWIHIILCVEPFLIGLLKFRPLSGPL